ncbi:hypothetical protein V8E53_014211 [Lactarius tabidus]
MPPDRKSYFAVPGLPLAHLHTSLARSLLYAFSAPREQFRPRSRTTRIRIEVRAAPLSLIPISALVTPHAPSIGRASSAYHIRDPRRPPRLIETKGTALSHV